jgi:hypothetical protein
MVEDYADRNLQSVFVYCREAHPGERYSAHQSFEQKMQYARDFKERFGVRRPILVDDLDGTAHRAFGTLPNMTYVLNQAHTVMFRANWTDPPTIKFAVDYLFNVLDKRRSGLRLNPFYAELHGFRWVNDEVFFEGLELAGQQAVDDFHRAREIWSRGEHLGSIRNKLFS